MIRFFTFFCTLLLPSFAFASDFQVVAADWQHALMGTLGGLTFLLYGLKKMTGAFKSLAGEQLRLILSNLTRTKASSVFTGITITAMVQSSTAVMAMVVGFISARIMSLPQSLGVILGADIGTTITVQLIAFRINQYALVAIIAGFLIRTFARQDTMQHIGRLTMSVGFIFFGIFLVSDSMTLLQHHPVMQQALSHVSTPLIGIAAGMLLTLAMQSSAGTLAIVIAIAAEGILPIAGAFFIVIGANIGSGLTSLVIASGARINAKRAAVAHNVYKLTGATICLAASPWILEFIQNLNVSETVSARQVAHMHSLFAIFTLILFIPFTAMLAEALVRFVQQTKKDRRVKIRYLDPLLLETSILALNAARNETARMAKNVSKMMDISMEYVIKGNKDDLAKIRRKEKEVDIYYRTIIEYLGSISRHNLTTEEGRELMWLMGCVNRFENISDLIGVDLYEVGCKRIREGIKVSAKTAKALSAIHAEAHKMLEHSVETLTHSTFDDPEESIEMLNKQNFKKAMDHAIGNQAERLVAKEESRLPNYALEMDMIDKLQRIYYHARKITQKTATLTEERSKVKEDTSDQN